MSKHSLNFMKRKITETYRSKMNFKCIGVQNTNENV